jgi:hypothetical protein
MGALAEDSRVKEPETEVRTNYHALTTAFAPRTLPKEF